MEDLFVDYSVVPKTLSIVTTTDPKSNDLLQVVEAIERLAVRLSNWQLELIIVDDLNLWQSPPSADDFPWESDASRITVMWYPERKGQFDAMLTGLKAVTGSMVFTLDPDMYLAIESLPDMLDLMHDEVQVVHGVREIRPGLPWFRRMGSQIANWLIRRLTLIDVNDIGSPVMLVRRESLNFCINNVLAGENPRLLMYLIFRDSLVVYNLPAHVNIRSDSSYSLPQLLKLFFALTIQAAVTRKGLHHKLRDKQ